MPNFVGFQSMGILVPYHITFNAVGVFDLAFNLLFKFCSTWKLTYFTGLMYLKKMFGNVSNAAINLSRRISPTSEVMKITKILDPGCKVAVDSKMQAW